MTSPVTTDVSLDTAESLPPGPSLPCGEGLVIEAGPVVWASSGGTGWGLPVPLVCGTLREVGSVAGAPELGGPNVWGWVTLVSCALWDI